MLALVSPMTADPEPRPHPGDLALAQSAARGDRRAAEALARRLLPPVRRVCLALLRGRIEAEDATQSALLEVLRSAGSYQGGATLERWAHRIAVRVTLRGARRQRDHHARLDADADADNLAGAPHEADLSDSLARPVAHYLEALSGPHRGVLLLRHALGHTVPEIAELLDEPVPTIKSRLLRAQDELRKHIRRDQQLGVRNEARRP
ncbi:MAG: RNA polymerase sigma factor [Myxococcales bacterium]|nr:RNA polymerase sigma factor [Myxococcales bacterium]